MHATRLLRISTDIIGGESLAPGSPSVWGDVVDVSSPEGCSSLCLGPRRSAPDVVPLSGGEMLCPFHTCDHEADDYVV